MRKQMGRCISLLLALCMVFTMNGFALFGQPVMNDDVAEDSISSETTEEGEVLDVVDWENSSFTESCGPNDTIAWNLAVKEEYQSECETFNLNIFNFEIQMPDGNTTYIYPQYEDGVFSAKMVLSAYGLNGDYSLVKYSYKFEGVDYTIDAASEFVCVVDGLDTDENKPSIDVSKASVQGTIHDSYAYVGEDIAFLIPAEDDEGIETVWIGIYRMEGDKCAYGYDMNIDTSATNILTGEPVLTKTDDGYIFHTYFEQPGTYFVTNYQVQDFGKNLDFATIVQLGERDENELFEYTVFDEENFNRLQIEVKEAPEFVVEANEFEVEGKNVGDKISLGVTASMEGEDQFSYRWYAGDETFEETSESFEIEMRDYLQIISCEVTNRYRNRQEVSFDIPRSGNGGEVEEENDVIDWEDSYISDSCGPNDVIEVSLAVKEEYQEDLAEDGDVFKLLFYKPKENVPESIIYLNYNSDNGKYEGTYELTEYGVNGDYVVSGYRYSLYGYEHTIREIPEMICQVSGLKEDDDAPVLDVSKAYIKGENHVSYAYDDEKITCFVPAADNVGIDRVWIRLCRMTEDGKCVKGIESDSSAKELEAVEGGYLFPVRIWEPGIYFMVDYQIVDFNENYANYVIANVNYEEQDENEQYDYTVEDEDAFERLQIEVREKPNARDHIASATIDVPEEETWVYVGGSKHIDRMDGRTLHITWDNGHEEDVKNVRNTYATEYGQVRIESYISPIGLNLDGYINSEEDDDCELNDKVQSTDILPVGEYEVLVAVNNKVVTSYRLSVLNPPVSKVVWDDSGEFYHRPRYEGDSMNYEIVWTSEDIYITFDNGLTVNYYECMNDPEFEGVTLDLYAEDPNGNIDRNGDKTIFDMKPGTYKLWAQAGEVKGCAQFEVKENPVEEIIVVTPPEKQTYYQWENAAEMTGTTFKLKYKDGTESRVFGTGEPYTVLDGYDHLGNPCESFTLDDQWAEGAIVVYDDTLGKQVGIVSEFNILNEDDEYIPGEKNIALRAFTTIADIPVILLDSPYTSMEVVKKPDDCNKINLGFGQFNEHSLKGLKLALKKDNGEEDVYEVTEDIHCNCEAYLDGYAIEASEEDGRIIVNWKGFTTSYSLDTVTLPQGINAKPLTLDERQIIKPEESGRYGYYSFTPIEDGAYYFTSDSSRKNDSSGEPVAVLLDSEGNPIIGGAGTVEEYDPLDYDYPLVISDRGDFEFDVELTAGQTYYLLAAADEFGAYTSVWVSREETGYARDLIPSVNITLDAPKVDELYWFNPDNYQNILKVMNQQYVQDVTLEWNKWSEFDEDVQDNYYLYTYGEEPEITITLCPYNREMYSAQTTVKINGQRPNTRRILADGALELTYKFGKFDSAVSFPEDESGRYKIISPEGGKKKILKAGEAASFTVWVKDVNDLERISAKVTGKQLSATAVDKTNQTITYSLEGVNQNAAVVISFKNDKKQENNDKYKVTFKNKDKEIDTIYVAENETIAETAEKYLPTLDSYTDGENQYFVGWYDEADKNGNGIGIPVTEDDEFVSDKVLYARFVDGIFKHQYNLMTLIYKIIGIDNQGRFMVEICNESVSPKLISEMISSETAIGEETIVDGVLKVPAEIHRDGEAFSVVSVAPNAFENAEIPDGTRITGIVLPETVTNIENGAFANCDNLQKIAIPDSVRQFPDNLMGEGIGSTGEISIICSPEFYEDQKEKIDATGTAKNVLIQSTNDVYYVGDVLTEEATYISASALVGNEEKPILWSRDEEVDEYLDLSISEDNELVILPLAATPNNGVTVEAQYLENGKVITSKSFRVFVTPINVEEGVEIEYIPKQIFERKPVTPKPVVSYEGSVLVEGEDYEFFYENNNKVGKANLAVSLIGNYCGVFTKEFQIVGVSAESVNLDKNEITIAIDERTTLVPTILPATVYNKKVVWSSSDESVVTVDQYGEVTGVSQGSASITAISLSGQKSATCQVTVKNEEYIHVSDITLTKENITMTVGDEPIVPVVTVSPTEANNKTLIWESDDEAVATVDENGTITPIAPGIADIFVTAEDGEITKTIVVTVKAAVVEVTGVVLSDQTLKMTEGDEPKILTAVVSPLGATDKSVTWSSSNEAVATVSESGIVTPVAAGETIITAKTKDGEFTATCKVTVVAPTIIPTPTTVSVTGVAISKTSLSMTVGDAATTLAAAVAPLNATNKAVTWTSSNTKVATVSSTGAVTPVGAGTATITVKTTDGGKTASCSVTVKAKEVVVDNPTTDDKKDPVVEDKKDEPSTPVVEDKKDDTTPVDNKKAVEAASGEKVTTTAKGEATLTSVKTSAKKSVKVVETIKVGNASYKVTTISASAFKNAKKATTVTLPKTVTKIKANAFKGSKITTVNLTVKKGAKLTIDKKAFKSSKVKKIVVKMDKKATKKEKNAIKKALTKAGIKAKNIKIK